MVRLRQRSAYEPTTNISGFAYNGTRAIASYSWNLGSSNGGAQCVEDSPLYARPTPHLKSKRNVMPPLNAVRMSKVSHKVPPGTWTYTAYEYPYVYRLTGGALGIACLAQSTLPKPDLRPYKSELELPLVQVSTKEASYLYQRALSKASSAEYDFGVTVGEVAETAAFLAKPLGGIAKLSTAAFAGVRAVYANGPYVCLQIARNATARERRRLIATTKKHPLDTSLRIVDESANHWLAYKFGVMPLLDDIAKGIDFRENNLARLLGIKQARVKGMDIGSNLIQKVTNLAFGYIWYDVHVFKRVEDRHYCGLYFLDKITSPLVNFMEGVGFAPWQLPSLAYELIPLSFVVDRFIDIKSFVRGNIGSLSKDIKGIYCTHKVTTHYSYEVSNLRWYSINGQKVDLDRPLQPSSALMEQTARVVNPDRPTFPVVNPNWQKQLIADATNLSLIWGRLRTHVGRLLT